LVYAEKVNERIRTRRGGVKTSCNDENTSWDVSLFLQPSIGSEHLLTAGDQRKRIDDDERIDETD